MCSVSSWDVAVTFEVGCVNHKINSVASNHISTSVIEGFSRAVDNHFKIFI